ncbi:hypothetical protein AMELA_G00197220 [Ameiurus melas]|uniref:Uncharacterized protein n=1 Tax=Ameiurus melas TaxID=219545 RepID=A0A7J6A5Y3_AMEME|nr:hypothetical protein AMELA_G00197220 [Ameiurus melas]
MYKTLVSPLTNSDSQGNCRLLHFHCNPHGGLSRVIVCQPKNGKWTCQRHASFPVQEPHGQLCRTEQFHVWIQHGKSAHRDMVGYPALTKWTVLDGPLSDPQSRWTFLW